MVLYSEESIFCARGEVYQYCAQTNSWSPLDDGLSRIDIYCLPDVRYRIVAVAAESHKVVMNMPIFRFLKCNTLSQVFREITALNYTFGINFVEKEDATNFTETLTCSQLRVGDKSIAPVPLRAFKTRYAKLAALNSANGLFHFCHLRFVCLLTYVDVMSRYSTTISTST